MPVIEKLSTKSTMDSSRATSKLTKYEDPSVVSKFLSAGLAASFAEAVTIPIDTAKVRLQVQGENAVMNNVSGGSTTAKANVRYRGMIGTIMMIGRQEGVKTLYNGLVPGIHRQMMFCGIRIGLYDHVKRFLGDKDEQHPKVITKILASCITGVMAVSCAHPTEVVKVRFQADAKRYQQGVMDAYATIFRKEGLRGLWKGAYANMARLCTVNASELVVYDMLKGFILRHKLLADEFPCHFVSAFGAGFAATCIASPVDVVKTRYMNSPPNTYKSGFNCAFMMLKHNGPTAFYKGFTPNFIRLGFWNILMFVSYEQLKRAFYKVEHWRN